MARKQTTESSNEKTATEQYRERRDYLTTNILLVFAGVIGGLAAQAIYNLLNSPSQIDSIRILGVSFASFGAIIVTMLLVIGVVRLGEWARLKYRKKAIVRPSNFEMLSGQIKEIDEQIRLIRKDLEKKTWQESVDRQNRVSKEEIASYLVKMEDSMAKAGAQYGETKNPNDFLQTMTIETEKVAAELDAKLRKRGLDYPTPNEPRATARALLWVGWISWMWTSKAERAKDPDGNAKKVRPLVDDLLDEFASTGRLLGKNGARPEDSLKSP